ncbi:MAG: hypothetical protein ILP02_00080, partial [Clostridia bacterium]|nr:hypothetical protein [Clostridia bacterium]
KYKLDKTYVIVNKVRGDLVKKGRQISVADVEQVIKAPVIGAIPDDDAVLTMTGASLESGSARKAYRLLAKRLISGRGKVYDCESAFRSPFIRLKRLFGKGA